jgi:aryl-alcohol dehydrogenase-like predicted oxidoreductase
MSQFKMNRRKFVSALGLGTAHVLFSNPMFAANPARFASNSPVQNIKLGKSVIETSLLGIGTGVHGGNRSAFLTRQEKEKSIAVIQHAYERGIRNFDTADTYGTHQLVGEALAKKNRSDYTLTSKIWVRGGGIPESERPDADVVVERFRKELNTDYIDLVQIHCMVDENWTETQKKQMDILEDLKAKGIIRAHGVSVHSLEAMKDAVKSPWVDVLHARINPYGMAMDKPDPEEVIEVIQQINKAGKGVIGMKLVGNGKLRDDSKKIDDSLRFVLGLRSVDMVIVGFESIEQIDNYMDRMENALIEINRG